MLFQSSYNSRCVFFLSESVFHKPLKHTRINNRCLCKRLQITATLILGHNLCIAAAAAAAPAASSSALTDTSISFVIFTSLNAIIQRKL